MKMTNDTEDKKLRGQLSMFSGTFQQAIALMTAEQLSTLFERVSDLLAGLESRWADDLTSFQSGNIDSLKRIKFRVGQQMEIVEAGGQARTREFNMICINCNLPVPYSNEDFICIMCGSTEWVEVDHIEPPSEYPHCEEKQK